MTRSLLFLCAALLAGCPVVDDDDSGGDDDDSTEALIAIPDPGSNADDTAWFADRDISSPGIAWEGGIINAAPFYVEADVPEGETGAYYVFEAGSEFTFEIVLFDGSEIITDLHMHDGNGLVFGDEITPSVEVEIENGNVSGTWEVEADSIYVLEVITAGAGFF